MATTLPWGEELDVRMQLGFPVNYFTLDDPTLGVLGGDCYLDGTLEGIDVSEYVVSVSTNRGRSDQLQVFSAGTCTVTLRNTDRRFDPINESSPYWDATTKRSGVQPRRKVTVQSDGLPVFVGRITDIEVVYAPTRSDAPGEISTVTISASDDFLLLANTYIDTALTPTEQLSGSRVTEILDLAAVNYPTTRQIASGVAVLGGGATYEVAAGTNALTYLQQVATSEQGYLYVSASGDLVFTDRVQGEFAAPIATFSDNGTDLPYSGLDISYGQEFLYNKIVATNIGGTEQEANSVESQADYGVSTLSLTELLLATDEAAQALADDLLSSYAYPAYRFNRLKVPYPRLTSGQRMTVTGLEIGQVIEVERSFVVGTPSSVSKPYSLEAIRHDWSARGHDVTYDLSVGLILYPLILDDPIYGIMDSTNALS